MQSFLQNSKIFMWWYSWGLDSWPRSLYDMVSVDQGLTCC